MSSSLNCTGCNCCHKEDHLPWKRLVLCVGILALAWGIALPFWLKLGLFITAYILCAGKVILRAIHNIKQREIFDENLLMTLATLGAFALGEYPEAICVMLFYQIGEALSEHAAGRSRAGIVKLLSLRAVSARIITQGQETIKKPEEVQIGEILLVRPGERVCLDGIILKGTCQADLSALTGESYPVVLHPGQEIFSGSICVDGVLEIRVQKKYQDSAIAQILKLTEQAAEKKSLTEKFITRFARIYTPVVVGAAVALAVIPPILLADTSFKIWFSRALVFLVVSCPCALVLSIPLGFFGGLGGAARQGILIKGGSFLEALARLHTLAFDKTGTLTKGLFEVSAVYPQPGFTKEKVLSLASLAETHSNHPLAKAILRTASKEQLDPATQWKEIAGEGVQAVNAHETILAGNLRFMQHNNIVVPNPSRTGTCIYIAYNGAFVGQIELGDPLKPNVRQSIRQLKRQGVKRVVILSGDTQSAVDHIARQVSIPQAYGGLLPAEKVTRLEELISQTPQNRTTAFVGDGINDAPVLARADVSIAMGGLGSDAAIETADVVLMTDELSKLVKAVKLSRYTLHIVKENVWLALGVKGLVLTLGVLGYANLWMAVFADVGVSLLAVANSLRPLYYRR